MNINNNTSSIANTFEISIHYLDIISRFMVLFSNITYFIIIFSFKKLKNITYFQMHHVNLIGLIQGIILTSWSFNIYPAIGDPILDAILCYISEILWGTLKHIRAYSVLVLAMYRYVAVFNATYFKTFSKCYKYLILSSLFVWLIPFILYFITKYSTNSTYGLFCRDGFNTNTTLFITYFTVTSLIGFILPTLFITFIYVKITNKIKEIRRYRLHNSNIDNQHGYALQLVIINILEVASFILIVNLGIPYQDIFSNNINILAYILIIDTINCWLLSLIPVITLYFLKFK
jgi:hypothetical protein